MPERQYRTPTQRTVDRLAADGKDAVFWDSEIPGVGTRVYPTGRKVQVVQTRTNGKPRRFTAGRHGDIAFDRARKGAANIIAPAQGRTAAHRSDTQHTADFAASRRGALRGLGALGRRHSRLPLGVEGLPRADAQGRKVPAAHRRTARADLGDRACTEAARVIAGIKAGREPLRAHRAATSETGPTVAEVAGRYMREYVEVRCKPTTVGQCRYMLDHHLLPALGSEPLGTTGRERAAPLHYSLHETPVMENQMVDMLSRLHYMAEGWGTAPAHGNPCRFVRKYKERNCERFLSEEEFRRLGRVLSEGEAEGKAGSSAMAAFRMLMLTGCRRNETLTLRWTDVDPEASEIHLPNTKTGARSVALSPAARIVPAGIPRLPDNPWVIVGAKPGARLSNHNSGWPVIRARVEMEDMRIHDLRYPFVNWGIALGESLPTLGKLLEHRKVQTTARYAPLARDLVKSSAACVAGSLRADLAGETVSPLGAP